MGHTTPRQRTHETPAPLRILRPEPAKATPAAAVVDRPFYPGDLVGFCRPSRRGLATSLAGRGWVNFLGIVVPDPDDWYNLVYFSAPPGKPCHVQGKPVDGWQCRPVHWGVHELAGRGTAWVFPVFRRLTWEAGELRKRAADLLESSGPPRLHRERYGILTSAMDPYAIHGAELIADLYHLAHEGFWGFRPWTPAALVRHCITCRMIQRAEPLELRP